MAKHVVAKVSEIPEGEGREFEIEGQEIAVFHYQGKFYAMDNICVHRGGALGVSVVEEGLVTCPLHGWQFQVRDGQNPNMDNCQQECFEVCVEGDKVSVVL